MCQKHATLDELPVLLWQTDHDGYYNFFNHAWLTFRGRTLDQEKGIGWLQGVHPEDLQDCLSTYVTSFRERQPFKREYRLKGSDNQYHWFLDTAMPRYNSEGLFLGYVGTSIDISNRKVIEKELVCTREQLKNIFSGLSHVYWSLNLVNFEMLQISPVCQKLFGYSAEQFYENPLVWFELVHPEDQWLVQNFDQELEKDKVWQKEYRIIHSDGSLRWIQTRIVPFFGKKEHAVRVDGLHRDITEEKKAQEELYNQEQLFQAVAEASRCLLESGVNIEAINDALAILGKATGVDRVYIFKNDRQPKTEEELVSQVFEWSCDPTHSQLDNEDLQSFAYVREGFERWHEALSVGDIIAGAISDFPLSERAILESQNIVSLIVVPILIDGFYWGFLGFDDCKKRRDWTPPEVSALRTLSAGIGGALKHHKKSEEHHMLLDNIETQIWYLTEQDRYGLANKAHASFLGREKEELVNRSLYELMTSEEVDVSINSNRHVFEEKKSLQSEEWITNKIGNKRLLLINRIPKLDNQAKVEYVICTAQDITEQKQAELALQSAKESAEAGNRAKSDFLAMMSHEIRTPLNAITNMIEMLLKTELNEQQKQQVRIAHISSELLLSVLNDILDLSKIEAGKITLCHEVFNLHELLEEMIALVRPKAQKKGLSLYLINNLNHENYFFGDPLRLRQILLNLISNAVKFTLQGEVVLKVKPLKSTKSAVHFLFEVQDTGIGIADNVQQDIFKPFSQGERATSRKFGGTGLGLTICKNLVQKMNGRIGVESEKGQGSLFWFEIPLIKAESTDIDAYYIDDLCQQDNLSLKQIDYSKSILVVEDNKVNQEVLLLQLEELGLLNITIVSNGVEALKLLKKEDFSLILMDCEMPELDGFETTKLIRKIEESEGRKKIPIIAMTAYALQGDKQRCLEVGMDDYMSKPLRSELLYCTLQQWIPQLAIPDQANKDMVISKESALSTIRMDRSALEKYRKYQKPDEPDLVVKLIKIYLDMADQKLKELKEALELENLQAVVRRSHLLKSSSADVGAFLLASYFAELEKMGRAGIIEGMVEKLQILEAEYVEVRQELEKWMVTIEENF
ncbi:PAS domain S-box protein [Heliorestis acidaminivorans]|uniref:Circadian input-output histidine kinase CikA n=1 Tax=Heliorestis acidaminivorans TaxID=553427 RepID=A0A6I0F275_9FIRM|nr:PAS domain S-box protein [Heliorestis acidaminivorans]KAB2953418.1 PAS domain S-box protein [Heliorestis acidaminivorans]